MSYSATATAAVPITWIWQSPDRDSHSPVCLKTSFLVPSALRRATASLITDHATSVVYVNGKDVGSQEPFDRLLRLDITGELKSGDNTFGVCARSTGPAALAVRIDLEFADGSRREIVSDASWQATKFDDQARLDWPEPNTTTWHNAVPLGEVVQHRWGFEPDTIAINPADDYTQWKRALEGSAATDPRTFQIAPGFSVELLRSAAKDEDSWISLTADPRGRWIIGQEKRGLLRVTLPDNNANAVKVERINDSLRECRGLVFQNDILYAMANVDNGLFRLRDTNGDDQFDKVEKLAEFAGDAGHGRNQLTLGPDGLVWGIFGDSVFEPASAVKLPPELAHPTAAEKTRSGFVGRFDADGSNLKVMVRGLRNPYGLDFNRHGDLFTYDADAEYDMGSPWYRPTRVNHLMPGGDYGWRRVTQQWPPYFPDRADMPQPTLDIGKGSPTAVEFCAGEQFPPRYRDALFALDWSYGRILAVHLSPRGSSYYATAETFLRGSPLNVTDIEFGPDGAMYFVTGGRGTQSALYRVRYTGPRRESAQPSPQEQSTEAHAAEARAERRRMESLIQQPDPTRLDQIWQQLGSDDPWLRHAARAALEKLPIELWRAKIESESNLNSELAARIAQIRRGEPVFSDEFNLALGDQRSHFEMLYLAERLLADKSLGAPQREQILNVLRAKYPFAKAPISIELSRILSEHPDDAFASQTLQHLARAAIQNERLHFLFVLRNIKSGWTPALRQSYFDELRRMDDYVGGEGLPTFRKLIRQEALAAVPADERPRWEKMLMTNDEPWLEALPAVRTNVVRKWTLDELLSLWSESGSKGDRNKGQELFAAARCIVCHRCGAPGGLSGPDLTSVARRFSPRDLLTSILDPSRAIDEKYATDTFELVDGRVITGRVMPGDYRAPDLEIIPNLLQPAQTIRFVKSDISQRTVSTVSPMPTGLLDSFTAEEIVDLITYVLSGEQRLQ